MTGVMAMILAVGGLMAVTYMAGVIAVKCVNQECKEEFTGLAL